MTCPACGSRNARTDRVCRTCGTVLSDLPKSQFDYQQAVLPESSFPDPFKKKSKTLSVVSLVLGLLSLTPASFITGIPAVLCAVVARRKKLPGTVMAYTGLVTGAVGTLVMTLAVFLPLTARARERARVARVKANMQCFRDALEAYAQENKLEYPGPGVSWEQGDLDGIAIYFTVPGLSRGRLPINPYSGHPYQKNSDFFYLTSALAEPDVNATSQASDAECPFNGLCAPDSLPGTIMILGFADPQGHGEPLEYSVIGFGRDPEQPLLSRPARPMPDDTLAGKVYFVLHN